MIATLIRLASAVCICVFVYACVNGFRANQTNVDSRLQPYVDSYLKLVKEHCPGAVLTNDYKITLEDDLGGQTWIGVCRKFPVGFQVEIHRRWFNSHSESDNKQLMYHELSHCFIGKEHDNSYMNYMFYQFYPITEELYTSQVILDIKEFCGNNGR